MCGLTLYISLGFDTSAWSFSVRWPGSVQWKLLQAALQKEKKPCCATYSYIKSAVYWFCSCESLWVLKKRRDIIFPHIKLWKRGWFQCFSAGKLLRGFFLFFFYCLWGESEEPPYCICSFTAPRSLGSTQQQQHLFLSLPVGRPAPSLIPVLINRVWYGLWKQTDRVMGTERRWLPTRTDQVFPSSLFFVCSLFFTMSSTDDE